MKISTFVFFILFVGVIFYLFSLIVYESNQQYPSANLSSADFETQYNYVDSINSTITPLKEKFDVIQNENEGFFTRIAAGIVAIPYAVILLPKVLFGTISTGSGLSTGLLAALAIPAYIIIVVLIGTLIWGLFKLLEFFQRVPV